MAALVIKQTGSLFGDLWHRYNDTLFEESVKLFALRFEANGFDLKWFDGKRCLDVGCGGGRYSIAMTRLGAVEVIGCDISANGLLDACRRGVNIPNLHFEAASALALPYADNSFDFVCCSGVLHHTSDPIGGLREITRVLKPHGKVFLLLYGKGGLRWPTIMQIRPYAQAAGYNLLDEAMHIANLPANKQRTFLDDLFVPIIQFYSWDEVDIMLKDSGYSMIERWDKGKLDHESSIEIQLEEFEQLRRLFEVAARQANPRFTAMSSQWDGALQVAVSALKQLDSVKAAFASGKINDKEQQRLIFGWGHHRVIAVKG